MGREITVEVFCGGFVTTCCVLVVVVGIMGVI